MKIQFIFLCALMVSACSTQTPVQTSAPIETIRNTATLPPQIKLPFGADKWRVWQCRTGSRFETRLSANAQQLHLRYQGREYLLNQIPSARPAIYESSHLAFFSDGETAAIGIPQSATLYESACRLGGR